MADWHTLVNYLRKHYTVSSEDADSLSLRFRTEGGREQLAIVWRDLGQDGHEYARIESAIALADDCDVKALLGAAYSSIVGGVVLADGFLMFRHTVPLLNLDENEIAKPLAGVVLTADSLEQTFSQLEVDAF